MQKNGPVPECQSRIWMQQLIAAIDYLHSHLSIAHRDLKLENVLLFEGKIVKVADFGFSKQDPVRCLACEQIIPTKFF